LLFHASTSLQPLAHRKAGGSSYSTNTVAHQLASQKMKEERSRPSTTLGEPIDSAVNCEQCDKVFRTVGLRDAHVDVEHVRVAETLLIYLFGCRRNNSRPC